MKALFLTIALASLTGCAAVPARQKEAASHAQPFIVALQKYHQRFDDYPRQLDDLRPKYLAADVPWYNHSDPKHLWFLSYERADQHNYAIYIDSNPCSQAVFKNGTFVAGYGPNFQAKPTSK